MPRPPNMTIGTIDDVSAALSAQREVVAVLAARWQYEFSDSDFDELQRLLDACDRIQEYVLSIRRVESAAYQKR
jgi:hypothetical protein